jgi:hypothetical protein
MANYNPSRPVILGNEWAAIHDERYEMDWFLERGYSFRQQTNGVAQRGEYFLSDVPVGVITSQCPFVSIYNKGNEEGIGPITRAVIPCSSAVNSGPNGAFVGDFTGATALQNPSDSSGFSFSNGPVSTTANGTLTLAFDTSAFVASIIFNPRILNVSFIYTASGDTVTVNNQLDSPPQFFVQSVRFQGANDLFYGNGVLDTGLSARGDLNQRVGRISLGEINPNWNNASWRGTSDWYPWTTARLALWDETEVANPLRFFFNWSMNTTLNTNTPILWYAALEITYAMYENRIMYGGRHVGIDNTTTLGNDVNYGIGTNFVMLRQATTLVTGGPLLLTGGNDYTVTTHLADLGDLTTVVFNLNSSAATNTRPTIHALRELYAVDALLPLKIRRPFTVSDDIEADRDEQIIPTVGIVVTGAVNQSQTTVESHGYSVQYPGLAGFLISTDQEFVDNNLLGPLSYPWVRFYARNGSADGQDADILSFASSVTPAQVVTITRAQLNALPEIVDGWKEVTLRFPVGLEPIFANSSTLRRFTWTVPGATARNSFEVLGADGIYADLTDSTFQTAVGKLYNPSGIAHNIADATFLFSTEPPTVTGVGVSTGSLAVTGIGTNCAEAVPACIPTFIFYNRVTWSTASVALTGGIPVTGFGYYELQRLDAVDNVWQTIMKATSPAVTGFNDWESRIAIQSSYRIRVVNLYGFVGPWSATVNNTPPSPALFMGGATMNSCCSPPIRSSPATGPSRTSKSGTTTRPRR